MKVVEFASRSITPELGSIDVRDICPPQQIRDNLVMFGAHFLLDAIGSEALDPAAHEQAGFVNRVAQRISSIAKHDKIAGLGHEGRHVSNIALYNDIKAFHRDA